MMMFYENLNKIILMIIYFFVGIFIPIKGLLYFTGFMIFVDTFTGIWAAKCRGEEITSKKLKGVLPKIIIYPLAIIIASWCEFLAPEIPFIKGATFMLIMIEGKSFLENCSDILGYDVIKLLRNYIINGKKSFLKNKDE
jgi:phage-related holin